MRNLIKISIEKEKFTTRRFNVNYVSHEQRRREKMKTLTSVSVNDINKKSFFRALSILIRKPQVINRKLSCSVNKLFLKINIEKQDFLQKFKNIDENLKDVLKAENICYQELTLDDDLEHVGEGSIYVSLDKHLPRFPNKYHAAYVLTIIGM